MIPKHRRQTQENHATPDLRIVPKDDRATTPGVIPAPAIVPSLADLRALIVPTPTQHIAQELYALGFNVFPLPYGQKAGWPHKPLQYVRLLNDGSEFSLLALTEGLCNLAIMMGRTSRNAAVLEGETAAKLDYHMAQFRKRQIPLWVVQSPSKKGGGHIYFYCSDGELENIRPGVMQDAELRGNRCYVLTVGSKHPDPKPNGTPLYQWLVREGDRPPTVPAAAIDWLQTADGMPIELKTTARQERGKARITLGSPYYKKTREYLESGHLIPPDTERNTRLFSAACDFHANGVSRDQAAAELAPIARASGLDDDEINRTIANAYSKPRTSIKSDPSTRIAEWQLALLFAEGHNWTGRSANTERAVFMALVERARLGSNDNGTFRASIREIAELAAIGSVNTVRKALKALQVQQLISHAGTDGDKRNTPHTARNANLWRFSDVVRQEGRVRAKSDTLGITPIRVSSSVSLLAQHAAKERGALGSNGVRVYHALLHAAQPLTIAQIAEHVNYTPAQVRYALKRLVEHGLVRKPDRRHFTAIPATDEQLTHIVSEHAVKAGKADPAKRAELRRARHQRDRALYAGRIIQLYRRRADPEYAKLIKKYLTSAPVWKCPDCGQEAMFTEFGSMPDICPKCQDIKTWQLIDTETGERLNGTR